MQKIKIKIKNKPASEILHRVLFQASAHIQTLWWLNDFLFLPPPSLLLSLSFSPSKKNKIKNKKPCDFFCFVLIRHGIKEKITKKKEKKIKCFERAHEEEKRNETQKNFIKLYNCCFTVLLFFKPKTIVTKIYLPPTPAPACPSSSRTMWNTWFNRDTFSVSPSTNQPPVKSKIDYLLF